MVLNKINKKLIFWMFISLTISFMYSVLRVFWITQSTNELYAMSNMWIYIELIAEVLGFMVLASTIYVIKK